MVRFWRRHGGWLKDINIYFFNVNHAKISDDTMTRLKEMGCRIIEPVESAEYLDMGFLTEPLCGKLAEESLSEEFLIKIDLDMCAVKPLSKELVALAHDNTLIEEYSDGSKQNQRPSMGKFNPFDTCFIISRRESRFYSQYYELCNSDTIRKNEEWIKLYNENGNYYLEEFVVDYMYNNNIGNIRPMSGHIFGEGYVDINDMTDDEVRSVAFIHSHMDYRPQSIDFHQQYIKRILKIGAKR